MPSRIRPKPTPPPPVPPPPAGTTTTSAPPPVDPGTPVAGIVWPQGNITTLIPRSNNPYGFPWSQVSRWSAFLEQCDLEFGVDPLDFAPMLVIETAAQHYITGKMTGTRHQVIVRGPGGTHPDDGTGVPSIGITQVKPLYHQHRVPDADAYDPEGNFRMAAALLAEATKQFGSFELAIAEKYFPDDDPNGTTQKLYLDTWRSLRQELVDAGTPPVVDIDPYEFMFGEGYKVNYGWLDDLGYAYYEFGVGHGTTAQTQHTGDDVLVPFGTPIFCPASGVVDCVGEKGTPRWGQACGAYEDTGTFGPGSPKLGVGNITIMLDSGHKLTLGHCRQAFVKPGDKVAAGQKIGTTGGQNGAHCHVEVSIKKDNSYWLIAPKPAIKEAMGNVHVDTRPRVTFAGASVSVPLDVPFRIALMPPGQKRQRPGTFMDPDRIVVHETGNYSAGANAEMHRLYMANGAPDRYGNPQNLGYHFAVDEKEIVQLIPINEITWHGGDGAGLCNMRGISIEAAVHDNNKHKVRVRENLSRLVAALQMAKNIALIEKHGNCCARLSDPRGCHTFCPESINQDDYWDDLLAQVVGHRGGGTPSKPVPTYANPVVPPPFDGNDKTINGVLFFALNRTYRASVEGVPVLQYADPKSSPVRGPLEKGERFEGHYLVTGADKKVWIVTPFGSRIPMWQCEPLISIGG